MYIAFLQNAWKLPYTESGWEYDQAYARSRTGKRMANLFAGVDYCHFNCTQAIGDKSSSRLKPDHDYIRSILHKIGNDHHIVAFGKTAAEAMSIIWEGPLLIVPHPCFRLLSNQHIASINTKIKTGFTREKGTTFDTKTIKWSSI